MKVVYDDPDAEDGTGVTFGLGGGGEHDLDPEPEDQFTLRQGEKPKTVPKKFAEIVTAHEHVKVVS